MEEVLAALLGFLGGMVGGLLGVGGGILFVPPWRSSSTSPRSRPRPPRCSRSSRWRSSPPGARSGYGNVRLKEGLLIGVLSPIGVAIGVVVANEVSERALELSFAAAGPADRGAARPPRPLARSRSRLGGPGGAVLEDALDSGVERVQAVESQSLRRAESRP